VQLGVTTTPATLVELTQGSTSGQVPTELAKELWMFTRRDSSALSNMLMVNSTQAQKMEISMKSMSKRVHQREAGVLVIL
jgi:hypothetical protein